MSEPGQLATRDQAAAQARDEAIVLARFHRALRRHGVPKKLARQLTLNYQQAWNEQSDGDD